MELLATERIWDRGPHNAFTDLAWFRDRWYCAFREGPAHAGEPGTVRILASPDGLAWRSVHQAARRGTDLRDPKLSPAPDGRLMLLMGGTRFSDGAYTGRRPLVSFSTDGQRWSTPVPVAAEGDWLWRVDGQEGRLYGVSYRLKSPRVWEIYLLGSPDGVGYQEIAKLPVRGRPNETTVRLGADRRLTALIRREGGDKLGLVGSSPPPYTAWTFRSAGVRLGGPNFIFLPDGRLLAGTRIIRRGAGRRLVARTVLGWIDPDPMASGIFQPALELPSDGDCSYPGLVLHADQLWVSYYSSHEGKASIYLARVRL